MNELRERAIWLLVHGDEPADYWREEAANDARLDKLRDEVRAAAAKPSPEPSPTEPAIAVGPVEAADMLRMSVDTLERRVLPQINSFRVGGKRVVPVAELKRWVAEH